MARRRRARRGSWKLRQSGSKAQGCFSLEWLEHRQLLTATGYEQINLVSDQSNVALLVDPNLVNPYGIAIGSGASDFWVANAGSNTLTRYNGGVAGSGFNQNALTISSLPSGVTGPTGLVANSTSDFVVTQGSGQGPAPFIFASRNGQLSVVQTLTSTTAAAGNNAASGSFYTSLALVTNNSTNNLYATNFAAGTIVKFGTDFQVTALGSGLFQDATLTGAGYAPYNIQVLSVGSTPLVFVTYAKQDSVNPQNIASDSHGAIDVFGLDGTLKAQLIGTSDTHLNAPWGLAVAPSNYGDLSNDLLVANGDGTIQAYSLSNVSSTPAATYVDALKDSAGAAIHIDGLHGLAFGN
ncbi:MAG TPA: TIGR03118 family protein, partial [Pirellulales bacterium]|nr:TIGR03118 family protein [Pirellulales bacterium]